MNIVVHKLKLPKPNESVKLEMPYGFRRLHVGDQEGVGVCLWYEKDVGVEGPPSFTEFVCIGTGWPIESDFWYLGTVQQAGFVWHYYARFVNE